MIVADTKQPATSHGPLAWSSYSSSSSSSSWVINNGNLHHFVIALAHMIH
jgi:hypothetical protein